MMAPTPSPTLEVIGKRLPRVDAKERVTGQAIYPADLALPGTAHAKLGMPLSDMLGYLLPQRVSRGNAAELGFTGRLVDADEALRMGLVDRVVPAAELAGVVDKLAAEIAQGAPLALHFTKQAIRRTSSEAYQEYMRFERYFFNLCLSSEDAKEAMRARREKRPPVYKGR